MSSAPPPPETVEALVQEELGLKTPPRKGGKPWLQHPPLDLYGLALSGGGIRSATFNLGLLQGLDRLGLLSAFHYVSTVSGGGYLGGFWTRWRHQTPSGDDTQHGEAAAGKASAPPLAFPAYRDSGCGPEPDEVRHLREYSNFLAPRTGLFSYDTGRMVVTLCGSMLPSLLAVLSVLVLALTVWLGLAFLLFGTAAGLSALTLAVLTIGVSSAFEWFWRRRKEDSELGWFVCAVAFGALLAVIAWSLLASEWVGGRAYVGEQVLPVLFEGASFRSWGYLFTPCLAWLCASAVFVVGRTVASRWMTSITRRNRRGAFDRVLARLLFLTAAWAVAAVIWGGGVLLYGWITDGAEFLKTSGVTGAILALTALSAKIQQVIGREPNRPSVGWLARAKAFLPQVISYAAIALLLAGMAAFILAVAGTAGGSVDSVAAVATVGAAVILTLGALVFFDPNEVGLHGFYRARLARAYCGASNRAGGRRTEEHELDDVALNELALAPCQPFPLICCAANDLTSDGMANLYRGARSAVLSRVGFSVGDRWSPWPPRYTAPSLSAAMTASGAAFNSLMGGHSVRLGPGVTFLLSAFNLRLGLWWTNPRRMREQLAAQVRWWERPKTLARFVPQGLRGRRWFVGASFYRELFGMAQADAPEVHLSDGGHFENTAVYELVRRHCRVIVASDCGQDRDSAFDDVGNLVRKVRQDFGVEIRIDLAPLRPGPDGRSRQHAVAGDIHYPDGDTGILLLFKPSLAGSEPADVAQYRARNDAFPQQSTVDQFYDEAQWEAYRRLGEHAVLTAFRRIVGNGTVQDAAYTFATARREWEGAPDGATDRLTRFADEAAALDAALREPGCEALLREVYPELRLRDGQLGVDGVLSVGGDGALSTADGQGGDRQDPEGYDPAATLLAVRRALGTMFEVYERENLEQNFGHPLYLGITNYFGRWTAAPLVRLWWPVLQPLFPAPFARFVVNRMGIASYPDAPEVNVAGEGFARTAWLLKFKDGPERVGPNVLEYRVTLRDRARDRSFTLQAAILAGKRCGDGETFYWDAKALFVPNGLWGIGLGQEFLRMLHVGRWPDPMPRLVARIEGGAKASAAEKAAAADMAQLYRSAGFVEAQYDVATKRLIAGEQSWELPSDVRVHAKQMCRWMVYFSPVPAHREEAVPALGAEPAGSP